MHIHGHAHKYGDHVDTDVIIPARYLASSDADELASHCMEDLDADFIKKVEPGDVIVAGRNFGCGSSREHAPLAIKTAGIGAVIAANFARIFYRNALNIGLPIIESEEAVSGIENGDEVEVDLEQGTITNQTRHQTYHFPPLVGPAADLVGAGGLRPLVHARLSKTG
jgi:3-isopropylmalate dehydratase small subunit